MVVECGHEFCKECIEDWHKNNLTRPTCRGEIKSLMKVPKLDLITENYLFLLQREKNLQNRKLIDVTLQQLINSSQDGKVDVSDIQKVMNEISITSVDDPVQSDPMPDEEEKFPQLQEVEENKYDPNAEIAYLRHRRTWKNQDNRNNDYKQRKWIRDSFYKNQNIDDRLKEQYTNNRFRRNHLNKDRNNEE